MNRVEIEKMLLREAGLCAADRRTRNRAARVVLSIKAEDLTSARSRNVAGATGAADRSNEQAASLLPWRDARIGAYRRLF